MCYKCYDWVEATIIVPDNQEPVEEEVNWKEHAHFLSKELERSQDNLLKMKNAYEDEHRRLLETEDGLEHVQKLYEDENDKYIDACSRLRELEADYEVLKTDYERLEDEADHDAGNARTLQADLEELKEKYNSLEEQFNRCEAANQSVAVCSDHTTKITEQEGLINNCLVCESEANAEEVERLNEIIDQVRGCVEEQ